MKKTKNICGTEMSLVPNPEIGQRAWVDVMGNGVYNPFTLKGKHPEVGTEGDDDWEPEAWAFEGTGTFVHYPFMGPFAGYAPDADNTEPNTNTK
jgi:hypothetical protein